MAKKHWAMMGEAKKEGAKVSKTLAQVGEQYKKGVSQTKLMKVTQVGLPLKAPSIMKAVGKGVGGMSARKKGWKKPGKRGIMGL